MRKNRDKEIEMPEVVEVMPWEVGAELTTRQDLYLWSDAGEEKLDWDDESIGMSDEFGKVMIAPGTRIVVKSVERRNDTYWIQTDFGWICGKNSKITFVS